MPFVLLAVIIALVIVLSALFQYSEGLALRHKYDRHRFSATAFLVTALLIVGVLEVLLEMRIVVFLVPGWLYWLHLSMAVLFLFSFLAKLFTALFKFWKLHLKLSKYFWYFWWATGVTAIFIGIWNAFLV